MFKIFHNRTMAFTLYFKRIQLGIKLQSMHHKHFDQFEWMQKYIKQTFTPLIDKALDQNQSVSVSLSILYLLPVRYTL